MASLGMRTKLTEAILDGWRTLGYDPIVIPKASIAERQEMVRDAIREVQEGRR